MSQPEQVANAQQVGKRRAREESIPRQISKAQRVGSASQSAVHSPSTANAPQTAADSTNSDPAPCQVPRIAVTDCIPFMLPGQDFSTISYVPKSAVADLLELEAVEKLQNERFALKKTKRSSVGFRF